MPWPAEPLPSRARRSVRVRVWGAADADRRPTGASRRRWRPVCSRRPTGPRELISTDVDRDPSVDRRRRCCSAATSAPTGERRLGPAVPDRARRRRGRDQRRPRRADVLTPGWTSYRHRLRYLTYDVTDLLVPGPNAIGVTVADGWFRGHIGFEGGLAQRLRRPGRRCSPNSRSATPTARRQTVGHRRRAGGPDSGPMRRVRDLPGRNLRRPARTRRLELGPASTTAGGADGRVRAARRPTGWSRPPVRRCGASRRSRRSRSARSPSGRTLVDFGQNLVGRVRIRVVGPAGHDRDPAARRGARARRAGHPPAAAGRGHRPLHPAAARGVETVGAAVHLPRLPLRRDRRLAGRARPGRSSRGRAAHRHGRAPAGSPAPTSCSNRLHENVVWGMRGNFVDLPTDCPQRDERLGWTGDIQVFAPTARFLYDCTGMLASWLADLAGEQAELGTVPVYVPYIQLAVPARTDRGLGRRSGHRAVGAVPAGRRRSSCSAASTPACGPGSTRSTAAAGADHVWNTGMQLGDWLDPTAPPDRPADARTDRIAGRHGVPRADSRGCWPRRPTCSGMADDTERYAALADAIRAAFRRRVRLAQRPGGQRRARPRWPSRCVFDLLDPSQRDRAGRRLVALVKAGDHRIGDRLRRHADHLRRAVRRRRLRHRVPPADPAAVPVLAVPGDHGRRPPSGNGGTACCPTDRSTRAT